MKKKTIKKTLYFLKSLLAGAIGTAIFFLLAIFSFALVKIIYFIFGNDLLISKYNITLVFAIFMIFGFIYGINCFVRRNHFYNIFKVSWTDLMIDGVLSLLFSFVIFLLFKHSFKLQFTYKGYILLFALLFVLFYVFSAVFLKLYECIKKPKKTKYKKSMWFYAVAFNPLFVLAYLFLFGLVVYNAFFIPCNVTVAGVDTNIYTANTAGLEIKSGEIILSIDGTEINSLQDVRAYIDSLDVTKEVLVETNKKMYYIKTYKDEDGERHIGLTLTQQICKKDY